MPAFSGGESLSEQESRVPDVEQLERELRLYRELVAGSSEGIYRLDFEPPVPVDLPPAEQVRAFFASGIVGAANDAQARMYGFDRGGELIGVPVRDMLIAEDPTTWAGLISFVEGGHRYRDVESVERDRKGEIRRFLNSAVGVIENGFLVAAWGSQRDVTVERQALGRLSESEQMLRAVFLENPLPILLTTVEDSILEEVNEAFLSFVEMRREDVVGRSSFELGLWDDPEARRRLLEELRSKGSVRQFPFVLNDRRGEAHEFLISTNVIQVRGRPCLLTAAENVTELNRAQRELAESERKFALVFRSNPGALALSTVADGRFLDVNDTFARLVGLTREQLIGRNALDLGLWPDAEERRRAFASIVEQGSASRVPVRVRSAVTGELREARISGLTLELGGEHCMLVLVEDVTELNNAQRAIAETAARFRAAAEGSLDAFGLLEVERGATGEVSDFVLAEINQRACVILGRARDELLGRRLSDLIREERLPPLHERYLRVFEDREALEDEFEVHPARGRRRTIQHQAVPLERGVAIWARDITDRRRAEQERRRLDAEFHRSQRFESLGLLAGGVAHDFNNLLTAILGYAEVALRRLPESSAVRAPISEIATAAQRAADLTHKMLAFSGGGPLQFTWVSLNEIVQEMVELARPALPRELEIRLALARPAPGLEADGTPMRQVVLNLILNASEAIEGSAGAVEISTGEVYCERERLGGALLGAELTEGRYAFLRVADDGAGMPNEVRERIFEPFFTTKFTGRGLGLAAVLGIVRAHGGAIEVESAVGAGTSVTVLLPLAQPRLG